MFSSPLVSILGTGACAALLWPVPAAVADDTPAPESTPVVDPVAAPEPAPHPKPAPDPFMTAIVTFQDLGQGRTRYTAIARHRNADTAKQHAEMGFHDGWGTVATQLEAYARGLMT